VLDGASLVPSLHERSIYRQHVNPNGPISYADAVAANDAHNVARFYGTGLFLAGTIALGTAAYLYFSAPNERHTIISPAVSNDQAGVVFAGSF